MSTYCYSDLNGGNMFEHRCPMGEAPPSITLAGVTLHRDIRAEHAHQKSGDAWTNHYCLSMGARTPEHAVEISEKCAAAHVSCEFDEQLNLRVAGRSHQKKLADAIFGKGKVINRDSYY